MLLLPTESPPSLSQGWGMVSTTTCQWCQPDYHRSSNNTTVTNAVWTKNLWLLVLNQFCPPCSWVCVSANLLGPHSVFCSHLWEEQYLYLSGSCHINTIILYQAKCSAFHWTTGAMWSSEILSIPVVDIRYVC